MPEDRQLVGGGDGAQEKVVEQRLIGQLVERQQADQGCQDDDQIIAIQLGRSPPQLGEGQPERQLAVSQIGRDAGQEHEKLGAVRKAQV